MRNIVKKRIKGFKEATGLDDPLDAAKHPSGSTSMLYNEFILAAKRFATFRLDSSAPIHVGRYAGVHVRVWADRVLKETVFIDSTLIVRAAKHDILAQRKWIEDETIAIAHDGNRLGCVRLHTYHDDKDENTRYTSGQVSLSEAEFANLVERLAPLEAWRGMKDDGTLFQDDDHYISIETHAPGDLWVSTAMKL